MWISKWDKTIQTYGMNGKEFLLKLEFVDYYGRNNDKKEEVVVAIYDSVCECFFEKKTNKKILDVDVAEFWEEDK